MSPAQTILPVILSGGSGTRLWPVSRESFPKQLWPLISDRSLIQETASRATGPGFAPPLVVCNQEHRFLIAEQLRVAGIGKPRIVLEPVGRNSAPAVAAAALIAAELPEHGPDTVLWMMAADAAIADTPALHRNLQSAVRRPGRPRGDLRHAPDRARDRLRLYRGGTTAARPARRARRRGVSGKARCRHRRRLRRLRPASVELRHVRVHRADLADGAGASRAGRAGCGACGRRRPPHRP